MSSMIILFAKWYMDTKNKITGNHDLVRYIYEILWNMVNTFGLAHNKIMMHN